MKTTLTITFIAFFAIASLSLIMFVLENRYECHLEKGGPYIVFDRITGSLHFHGSGTKWDLNGTKTDAYGHKTFPNRK